MTDPLGVILAGGQSRRMGGGDKALLALGDGTLLSLVIARLRPQVDTIALNANGDAARFSAYGLAVIQDSITGFAGPLAGVLAGLDWAASQGASHIVTVAADTPFFPLDLSLRLQAAVGPSGLAMAATPDPERGVSRHPTFGLWPVALREDLRAALSGGLRKVVLWTDRHGCPLVQFPIARGDPFFNINTPDDMAQARRILAEDQT